MREGIGAAAAALLGVCALAAADEPRVNVVNKGFSGRNSRDALALLEKEVLPLKAAHAVVYFGMNDAMNSANLLPLADYEANLRAIVKRLADGGARTVALVTLNPVIESYVRARHPKHPQKENLQAHLASYDGVVRKLAAEQGLPLVDLRALIEENGGTGIAPTCLIRCERNGGGRDGVHLTPAAYALLGQRTFEAIGPRVKPGETVVCFGDSLTFGANVQGAGTATGETYPAALQRAFDARR
jgi:lysophospholipase L1-like esterase